MDQWSYYIHFSDLSFCDMSTFYFTGNLFPPTCRENWSAAMHNRIPYAETWHHYMGEPLMVYEVHDDGQVKMTVLGPSLRPQKRPQHTVPPKVCLGAFLTHNKEPFMEDDSVFIKRSGRGSDLYYSFVGVTCRPGEPFEDDELATRDGIQSLDPKAEAYINYHVPS